jgi:hypothetical protein
VYIHISMQCNVQILDYTYTADFEKNGNTSVFRLGVRKMVMHEFSCRQENGNERV